MKHKVYFYKVNDENLKEVPEIAKQLLKKVILDNKIKLENEIPLKVHPGNPGNVTFIKPKNFDPIIKYLQDKKITTYYIETNQAPVGARSKGSIHVQIAKNHGFTQIPFVIADGEDGYDHTLVKIKDGKHFKDCKIAKKLVNQRQIIVLSHFKGHVASGFGGAIKMLSLGFASGRGKIELHSKVKLKKGEEINTFFREVGEGVTDNALLLVSDYNQRIRAVLSGKPLKENDKFPDLMKSFKRATGTDWSRDFDLEKYKVLYLQRKERLKGMGVYDYLVKSDYKLEEIVKKIEAYFKKEKFFINYACQKEYKKYIY